MDDENSGQKRGEKSRNAGYSEGGTVNSSRKGLPSAFAICIRWIWRTFD